MESLLESTCERIEKVRIHKSGFFGELALTEDTRRAATIICKKDCHFFTIEKYLYNELLKRAEQR